MARRDAARLLRRAFSAMPPPRVARPAKLGIPGVDYIFAVASGKGGVGKSTTAVNLAVALAQDRGLGVGLLDADVFGPSIPRMMKLGGRPQLDERGRLLPLENYGVKCMSMGFLMQEDDAAVWRGPMVMSAIDTFCNKVDWSGVRGPMVMSAIDTFCNKVDWSGVRVMVIDMPPGTGDAQLSITQRLPLAGAVIVSTPQDIALIDARRGVSMFRQVAVPILGVVENQSFYTCPGCGHEAHIFGHGGAAAAAREMGVDVLGEVPLDPVIRQQSDAGAPVVVAMPDGPQARAYLDIAARVKSKLLAGAAGGGARSEGPTITVD